MQQASCLEGGPLLWIWPLYLHVNKKSDDDGELLENVQRRAMRIVPELRGLNYRERLEKLNLPTLYHRRKHYDRIQLFRIVHGYEDIKPEKFLKFIDNCTSTYNFFLLYLCISRMFTEFSSYACPVEQS